MMTLQGDGPIDEMDSRPVAQRLRGSAPVLYASAIISSSQASLSAGVARSAMVSFSSSFAAQLRESFELDQVLDRGNAYVGRGQNDHLTSFVKQVEVDRIVDE